MTNKLAALSVTQLESLISKYPWFALARIELYLRTSAMGEEYRKLGMKRAGIYVPSREQLAHQGLKADSENGIQSGFESETENIIRDKQAVRVIGGDWFSQEDLKSIEEEYTSPEQALPPEQAVTISDDSLPKVSDEIFYTETLARIYGEQELHQMAVDIYEKLILLYPEKSTYFAALIQEQKKYL